MQVCVDGGGAGPQQLKVSRRQEDPFRVLVASSFRVHVVQRGWEWLVSSQEGEGHSRRVLNQSVFFSWYFRLHLLQHVIIRSVPGCSQKAESMLHRRTAVSTKRFTGFRLGPQRELNEQQDALYTRDLREVPEQSRGVTYSRPFDLCYKVEIRFRSVHDARVGVGDFSNKFPPHDRSG